MVYSKFVTAFTACTLLTLGGHVVVGAQTSSSSSSGSSSSQSSGTSSSSNQVTVPFSDPSRPGTVKVNVFNGSIEVRAGSGREVIVTTNDGRDRDDERERERERARERSRGGSNDDPSAGLRRLTQPGGVNIEESNNTVSITAPMMSSSTRVAIQVPAATNLELRSVNGGQVSVEGVTGSIEVNNVNGRINLTDVGGPVIAHATNGRVVVTLKQLPAGKPMSFTSFNGDVDVTVPASAKANLKMRSDRGDVYTDFDVKTTQAPPQSADAQRDDRRDSRDKDKAKYRLEMDRSIYGTVNGGGPDFELRTFNGNIYLRKAK